MADSCALARARLVDFVGSLREASRSERIITGIKAGMVGGPMTLLKQWTGNLPFAVLDQLAVKPLSVVADQLVALGKSAYGGFKVSPRELRSTAFALDPVGLQLAASGVKKGFEPTTAALNASRTLYTDAMAKGQGQWQAVRGAIRGFVDELRVQLNAQEIERSLEQPDRIKMNHAWSQYVTDGIYGMLEAQDRPFFYLAHHTSLWTQAKVMAMREGLSGAELTARAKVLFEHPTDEMTLRAYDDALYATFKDQRALSRAASGMKRTLRAMADTKVDPEAAPYIQQRQKMAKGAGKVMNYLAETNVPFTGVPSSTAMKGFDLSPLGSVLALLPGADQRHIVEVVSRAGVGTGMIAAGMLLYKQGKLTGGRPRDRHSAQWDVEHKPEFSIKGPDGEWHSLKAFMPFSLPLMIGASIAQAKDYNTQGAGTETATEQALRAPFYVGQAVTSQTYLQQMSQLIDVMTDNTGAKASRFLASQVPVPQAVRDVRRVIDPVSRAPSSFRDRLVQQVPGLSKTLPARTDALGREEREDEGPAGRLTSLVDPTSTRKPYMTPGLAEMDRLGVTLSMPSRTLSVPGTGPGSGKVRLPEARWQQLARETNPEALAEIDRLVTNPRWRRPTMTDDQRRDQIEGILRDAKTDSRDQLSNELFQLSRQHKQ